jgi:hypothetical protein
MPDVSRSPSDDQEPAGMPDASSPALGLVDGPDFVVAPRHRLFAVFHDPAQALGAIRELTTDGLANSDVWVYVGEHGAESVEPGIANHGPGVAVVRLAQRLLTNDCEYCERLGRALREHGMVLAIELERPEVAAACTVLAQHGGHSFAYGEHWNFVAVGETPQ